MQSDMSKLPNCRFRSAVACLIWLTSVVVAVAQPPKQLSESEIEKLTQDGDRLADQKLYKPALEKYTEAYTGVVSKIRGQAFSKPVEPSIFNRETLGLEMERMMEKEMTADDLALLDGTLKVFGFVKPELDPAQIYKDLLTEQVAGFYDPDDKRMVLIVEEPPEEEPGWLAQWFGGGSTFNKDEQKTTLAHELTHALQDQLYDLNSMDEGIQDDDDMLLAFSALVEGDATLLMFCEMQNQDISEIDPVAMRATFIAMSFLMPIAGGEAYSNAPDAFRDTLTFPYFQGMLFVLSQGAQHGWDGIHQMYKRPPLSTEQILHPEKYELGDGYDGPQSIAFSGIQSLVPKNWKSLGGSCLGELQTRILLKRTAGGKKAAPGWDGDHYEVYQDDDRLALLYGSVWDSEQDALEFASTFARYLKLLGDRIDPAALENETLQLEGVLTGSAQPGAPFAPDAVYAVHLDGRRVWASLGFDKETSAKLIAQLPNSTVTEKSFPFPKPLESNAEAN